MAIPTNFEVDGSIDTARITTALRVPITRPTGAVDPNIPLPPDRADIERARQSGNDRKPDTPVDAEVEPDEQVADLAEKGDVMLPEAIGDESMSNENQAFNNAVGTAFNFFALANQIKNIIPKDDEVPTQQRFFLTDEEKRLLERRASEFASIGVVPYDVLEDFLYVLVSIDNFKDLEYVALTIGLIEIVDPKFVRNVKGILNTKELYRIGYIANGLACLTKQFAEKYEQSRAAADSSQSSFASFSGGGGGGLSFGGIQNIISGGQQILQGATSLVNLTQQFGSGGVPDLLQQISQVPNVVNQLLGTINNLQNTFKSLGSINIEALAPQLNKLNEIANDAKLIDKLAKQLGPIDKLAEEANLVRDVREQLSGIKSKMEEVQQRFAQTLQEITSAKPPGNIAELFEQLKVLKEGDIGFNLMKQVMGQVPPMQILANNPLLKEPTGIGKMLFGQFMGGAPALDQLFSRKIAMFASPVNAAATNSFGFQNFGSFGGGQPLDAVVNKILSGGVNVAVGSALESLIGEKANDVANLLGSAVNGVIELRRSDNAIPLMISMTSALAGEIKSPFSTGIFSDAWKLASSVGNIVQDRNPEFLKSCRTNL